MLVFHYACGFIYVFVRQASGCSAHNKHKIIAKIFKSMLLSTQAKLKYSRRSNSSNTLNHLCRWCCFCWMRIAANEIINSRFQFLLWLAHCSEQQQKLLFNLSDGSTTKAAAKKNDEESHAKQWAMVAAGQFYKEYFLFWHFLSSLFMADSCFTHKSYIILLFFF